MCNYAACKIFLVTSTCRSPRSTVLLSSQLHVSYASIIVKPERGSGWLSSSCRGGGGDNAGQIWGIDQISHRKNLNFCGLDAQFLGGASTE